MASSSRGKRRFLLCVRCGTCDSLSIACRSTMIRHNQVSLAVEPMEKLQNHWPGTVMWTCSHPAAASVTDFHRGPDINQRRDKINALWSHNYRASKLTHWTHHRCSIRDTSFWVETELLVFRGPQWCLPSIWRSPCCDLSTTTAPIRPGSQALTLQKDWILNIVSRRENSVFHWPRTVRADSEGLTSMGSEWPLPILAAIFLKWSTQSLHEKKFST